MLKNERAQEGLRELRKKEKLANIEAAARELFADKGFAGTTTRELARRAGIGVGTLFVYFPGKIDLLFHLFRTDLEPVIAESFTSCPAEASLLDQLMHVFGWVFDYYETDPRLARVFVQQLLFLEGERLVDMTSLNLGYLERLAELVEQAKQRGQVGQHVFSLQAAFQLFSLYYLNVISWLGGTLPRESMQLQLRACLELLFRGLDP